MPELLWSFLPAELLYLMDFFSLSSPQSQAAVGGELCLCVAALKNPDRLVYGCRKLWRSEEHQLLSRHLTHPPPHPHPPPRLLFPLSQEPNTGPGHRDPAGECLESSQHICSLLCTFSPLWGCKERRRFQGKSPRSQSSGPG